ncbi:hypothetical protein TM233_38540 [Bradyrhizobium sp. TM233]|nr:hypothetical protein TM233_38540 [Bradyrhizobium sp. TM233]
MPIDSVQPSIAGRDCSGVSAPAADPAAQSPTAGIGAGAGVVHACPAPSEVPLPPSAASDAATVSASEFFHLDGGLDFAAGTHPVNPEQALTPANHKPGIVASQSVNMSVAHKGGNDTVSVVAGFKAREATLAGASAIGYSGSVKAARQVGPVQVGVAGTLYGSNALHVQEDDAKGLPAGYRYGQVAVTVDSKHKLPDGGGIAVHAEAGYRAGPGLNNRVNLVAKGTLTEHVGPVTLEVTGAVIAGEWTDRTPQGLPRRQDALPSAEVKVLLPVSEHVRVFAKVGGDGRYSNQDDHGSRNYANFGGGVGIQFSQDGPKSKPKN